MQVRSKSAQERKQESVRRDLQSKLDWILNEKYPSMELKERDKEPARDAKTHRHAYNRLPSTIQKVESIENMQLVSMKSAIHELQDLVTPTNRTEQLPECQQGSHNKGRSAKSFIFEAPQPPKQPKDTHLHNKIESQQNHTVQYYKVENQKLKTELEAERTKNEEFVAVIKKLEHANAQMEKEVDLLLHKWQKEHINEEKITGLQQDFRQQLIINLELEQLLLKQKLQLDDKTHTEKHQENHKVIAKQLKQQLADHKKNAEKEMQALRNAMESKDKEISQLKDAIAKLNEAKSQEELTSLHLLLSPPANPPINFMERFANFSKEMEARLSQQQVVSTNPSLQDTAMMDEAKRKNSESQFSKGNCPSVEIPMLEVRGVQNKPSSKTNRT